MKRSLALAGVVGVGMAGGLGAVGVGARHEHPTGKVGGKAGAAEGAPVRAARGPVATGGANAPPSTDMDALLADGSPGAWGNVASLYSASDEGTKRKVLQHVARLPELHRVIGYLLATVGEDPTPPADDPMVDEASALLQSR